MDHLAPDRIAAYVAGKLGEEEAFYLETHLAACPQCARGVRAYRFVSEHADFLFGSWSAKKASRLAFHRGLCDALSTAALPAEMLDRLTRWAEDFITRTRAVLRITLESAKKSAGIIEDEWGTMSLLGHTPAFQPAPAPIRVRGDHEPRATAVDSIGEPRTRITADPSLGRIAVRLGITDPPWPLAVLVPLTAGNLQTADFRHVEGEDYLIATFEDLEDGEYTLLLEETYPEGTPSVDQS